LLPKGPKVIPVVLGLGSLFAKVAAAAAIPRVIKALSAMGGATEAFRANPSQPAPETVSAPVQQSEKVLYKKYPLTDHSYRYSTYGERTKVGGDLDSDWGWAGLFHHEPSGLHLATYRVYDSKMGRWISRDPLGEGVDYNLYRYCGNSPVNFKDPDGLNPVGWAIGRWVVTMSPEIGEGTAAVVETVAPYAGSLLDFLPAWAGPAAAGTAGTAGTAGYYLVNGQGQAIQIQGIGPRGPIPLGGTSGGYPFNPRDPYSPEQVQLRIRPEFRPNPKHNPRSPHRGASPEPCDSEQAYQNAKLGSIGTWWGKGRDGWYRFSSDNAGGAHYSGTFSNNDPRVPNFLK
jgi:RHS repeat-associated protein